jgi:sugar phosphate isomerase/epimerase
MIKSCVTIALIPEIKTGPWIFWEDLASSLAKAAALGFDAVELFTRSGDALDPHQLDDLLEQHQLKLAAVGTGAGKVIHGLTLVDPDPLIRRRAIGFISEMIAFGAGLGAPAIIGSMQGNIPTGIERTETLKLLAEGLDVLGDHAGALGVPLLYEPLNRYESNLLNTLESAAGFLDTLQTKNIKLLADLFHMNIEEANLAESIYNNGAYIGHVHFADSNRKPMGFGHTDMSPIAKSLKEIGYSGYVSAEAFPFPDSDQAAAQTISAFKTYFSSENREEISHLNL